MKSRTHNPTKKHARRQPALAVLRHALAAGFTIAIAVSLSGCLFNYDAAKPTVEYTNDYAETVFVFIEGTSPEVGTPVEPQKGNAASLLDCVGEGLRVETESGEELGQVDEQACPGWLLTIHEDGSLTYEEIAD